MKNHVTFRKVRPAHHYGGHVPDGHAEYELVMNKQTVGRVKHANGGWNVHLDNHTPDWYPVISFAAARALAEGILSQ